MSFLTLMSATGVVIPDWIGELLFSDDMVKGAGHRYIRRVATGNPRRPWRYYYSVTGGKGAGHEDEFQVGSKFKVSHEGKAGHFEILGKTDSGELRIKHDETGHTATVSPAVLRDMIHREHATAISAHREKLASEIKSTTDSKARERLKAEASKYSHTADLAQDAEASRSGVLTNSQRAELADMHARGGKTSVTRGPASAGSRVEGSQRSDRLHTLEASGHVRKVATETETETLGRGASKRNRNFTSHVFELTDKGRAAIGGDVTAKPNDSKAPDKAGAGASKPGGQRIGQETQDRHKAAATAHVEASNAAAAAGDTDLANEHATAAQIHGTLGKHGASQRDSEAAFKASADINAKPMTPRETLKATAETTPEKPKARGKAETEAFALAAKAGPVPDDTPDWKMSDAHHAAAQAHLKASRAFRDAADKVKNPAEMEAHAKAHDAAFNAHSKARDQHDADSRKDASPEGDRLTKIANEATAAASKGQMATPPPVNPSGKGTDFKDQTIVTTHPGIPFNAEAGAKVLGDFGYVNSDLGAAVVHVPSGRFLHTGKMTEALAQGTVRELEAKHGDTFRTMHREAEYTGEHKAAIQAAFDAAKTAKPEPKPTTLTSDQHAAQSDKHRALAAEAVKHGHQDLASLHETAANIHYEAHKAMNRGRDDAGAQAKRAMEVGEKAMAADKASRDFLADRSKTEGAAHKAAEQLHTAARDESFRAMREEQAAGGTGEKHRAASIMHSAAAARHSEAAAEHAKIVKDRPLTSAKAAMASSRATDASKAAGDPVPQATPREALKTAAAATGGHTLESVEAQIRGIKHAPGGERHTKELLADLDHVKTLQGAERQKSLDFLAGQVERHAKSEAAHETQPPAPGERQRGKLYVGDEVKTTVQWVRSTGQTRSNDEVVHKTGKVLAVLRDKGGNKNGDMVRVQFPSGDIRTMAAGNIDLKNAASTRTDLTKDGKTVGPMGETVDYSRPQPSPLDRPQRDAGGMTKVERAMNDRVAANKAPSPTAEAPATDHHADVMRQAADLRANKPGRHGQQTEAERQKQVQAADRLDQLLKPSTTVAGALKNAHAIWDMNRKGLDGHVISHTQDGKNIAVGTTIHPDGNIPFEAFRDSTGRVRSAPNHGDHFGPVSESAVRRGSATPEIAAQALEVLKRHAPQGNAKWSWESHDGAYKAAIREAEQGPAQSPREALKAAAEAPAAVPEAPARGMTRVEYHTAKANEHKAKSEAAPEESDAFYAHENAWGKHAVAAKMHAEQHKDRNAQSNAAEKASLHANRRTAAQAREATSQASTTGAAPLPPTPQDVQGIDPEHLKPNRLGAHTADFEDLPAGSRNDLDEGMAQGSKVHPTNLANSLHPDNKVMRGEFHARTGIKLPDGVKATHQAVKDWHDAGRPTRPAPEHSPKSVNQGRQLANATTVRIQHAPVTSFNPSPKEHTSGSAAKRMRDIVSTDKTRPQMHHAHVEGGMARASDGHRAVLIPVKKGEAEGFHDVKTGAKVESGYTFPDMSHALPRYDEDQKMTVHAPTLHAVADLVPKSSRNGHVLLHSAQGRMYATPVHDGVPLHPPVQVGAGSAKIAEKMSALNPSYVKDALHGAKGGVRLAMGGELDKKGRTTVGGPVSIEHESGEHHYVMPLRSDRPSHYADPTKG